MCFFIILFNPLIVKSSPSQSTELRVTLNRRKIRLWFSVLEQSSGPLTDLQGLVSPCSSELSQWLLLPKGTFEFLFKCVSGLIYCDSPDFQNVPLNVFSNQIAFWSLFTCEHKDFLFFWIPKCFLEGDGGRGRWRILYLYVIFMSKIPFIYV